MRRRVLALGTAAAVFAGVAATQQGRVRRIGVLWGGTFSERGRAEAIRLMKESGAVEGRDYVLLVRSAAGDVEKLPQLSRELVAEGAEIILVTGDAVRAPLNATTGVPVVVFGYSAEGIAALAAEGHRSRLAGIDMQSAAISQKRIELLSSCLPRGARVVMVIEPRSRESSSTHAVEQAAAQLGIELHPSWCDSADDLAAALALARRIKAAGLYQHVGSFLASLSAQLIALATEARLADMYEWPSSARQGGLMGYGPAREELYRQFYAQAWRILRGAAPASLPVEGPMRVHLSLNMARARFLGLRIPPALQARADDIIG
jgi:putative tryptophan/tyrosine transport system substrate-binding protein